MNKYGAQNELEILEIYIDNDEEQVDLVIWTSTDLPEQSIEEVPNQIQEELEQPQLEVIAPLSLFMNNGLNVEKAPQ